MLNKCKCGKYMSEYEVNKFGGVCTDCYFEHWSDKPELSKEEILTKIRQRKNLINQYDRLNYETNSNMYDRAIEIYTEDLSNLYKKLKEAEK